jgi:hypothetical protein
VPSAIAVTAVVFVAPTATAAAAAAAAALLPPLSSPPSLLPLLPLSLLPSLLPLPPPPPPAFAAPVVGLPLLHCCCHHKDCIVPPPPHHHSCHCLWSCCMSSTPVLLLCHSDHLASLPSRCPPPARLALSPTPPLSLCCPLPHVPCIVHHPPSLCYPTPACCPSYLYRFDCCVHYLPIESLTPLFFENPADCQCGGWYHNHNVHADVPIITPTHKPLHQYVGNGAC